MIEITAGATVNDEKVESTVYKDFGSDLSELSEKFGEQQIYNLAVGALEKKVKSAIRRELKAGTNPEEVNKRLENWKPDVKHKVAKDPKEAATQAFLSMSDEQQEEYLANLRSKMEEKG